MESLDLTIRESATAKRLHLSTAPPIVAHGFVDAAYAADRMRDAAGIAVEIVPKRRGQLDFKANLRRRVVKRWSAKFGRNRCLSTAVEVTVESAKAFCQTTSAMLLIQRSRYSV